jgi:hypothetical protein
VRTTIEKMDYEAEQAQELEILESIYTEEEFESPLQLHTLS